MQTLRIIKTRPNGETACYCDICDTVFGIEFVKMNQEQFMDIHRHIHRQMDLDTPDLPEK